jgi:hypothetical protein
MLRIYVKVDAFYTLVIGAHLFLKGSDIREVWVFTDPYYALVCFFISFE